MHWILGTAGHIDHGKTSLIKALTGTDTDRLKEEKERGISIDIGFASLTLPDGSRQVVGGRGIVGYRPPCAPAGAGQLHYQFQLLALDQMLSLPSSATRLDVLKAVDGHIIGTSTYYATLERVPQ